MNNFIYVVLLAIFIPLTHFAHIFLNATHANNKINGVTEERVYLPSPELTKLVSLGYDNFLADLFWLKLIQYYGDTSVRENILTPDIFSLTDNITTLDPRFIDAYIFGSFALIDNKEFDKATTILDKGISKNPKEWYLPYQLGFLYYINKKNKVVAANYFKKAGDIEGAPIFTKRLAANIYAHLKTDLEIRRELWEGVYNKAKASKDSVNVEKASKELIKIKIEMDIEKINNAIAKYNEKAKQLNDYIAQSKSQPKQTQTLTTNINNNNQVSLTSETPAEQGLEITKLPPLSDLSILVKDGFIDSIPLDPLNRPYIYDAKTQKIEAYTLPWEKR